MKTIFNFVIMLLVILGLGITFSKYHQSSDLKKQADLLMEQGKTQEAIIMYEQARGVFPWRQDVVNDLEGAQLVLQSDLDYGQIYQIGAETQILPPLSILPSINKLQPNEIFVPILMYHHIRVNPRPGSPVWASLNLTPDQLNSQLQYLTSHGYQTISLDELYLALTKNTPLPSLPIVLTFDDGYRTFYDSVFPLLKKYKVKAVEFVITQVEGAPAYLTWDQIMEIDASGLVQWGAHTRHHPNLPDLSTAAITNEIKGSKADLELHLKKPITWFAYPYGSYNNFIVQTVQDSGFVGAVSTIYGAAQSKDKLYLAPRIMVDGRFSLAEFIARIQK